MAMHRVALFFGGLCFATVVSLAIPSESANMIEEIEPLNLSEIVDLRNTEEAANVELIIEKHPNRTVKVERQVTQDANYNYMNHGRWIMWDLSGKKVAHGQYRHGERHGKWTKWFDASEIERLTFDVDKQFKLPLVSNATFVDGDLNGVWSIVDADGRQVASWEFDHGKLHGASVLWFANQKKRLEAHYLHGVLDGKVTEWTSSGSKVSQRTVRNGREFVYFRDYYKNSSVKVEGELIHAQKVTHTNVDWWSGSIKNEFVDTVGDDERNGLWTFRYPDGEKQLEIHYVEGQTVGRLVGWYENGQMAVEGHYVAGKQHGVWTWWHLNGQKKVHGEYRNGGQIGNWVQWHDDGKVVYVEAHTLEGPERQDTSATEKLSDGTHSSEDDIRGELKSYTPPARLTPKQSVRDNELKAKRAAPSIRVRR